MAYPRVKRKTSMSNSLFFASPRQTVGKIHPYLFTQCQAIHARSLLPCQVNFACLRIDRLISFFLPVGFSEHQKHLLSQDVDRKGPFGGHERQQTQRPL